MEEEWMEMGLYGKGEGTGQEERKEEKLVGMLNKFKKMLFK